MDIMAKTSRYKNENKNLLLINKYAQWTLWTVNIWIGEVWASDVIMLRKHHVNVL